MLKRFSVTDSGEDIVHELEASGGVIIEKFLTADLVGRLRRELDPERDVASHKGFINPALAAQFGTNTRNVHSVTAKSTAFVEEVLPHPVYMDIADRVLRPNCAAYLLNTAAVFDRGPGSEAQMLHRDELVWPRHMPPPHQYQFSAVIALDEFTAERGATLVVPGSNHWLQDRQPRKEEIAVAEMEAGSVVVYLGSTLHGAGGNSTKDKWRPGLHMSYCLGWLRTLENQYLSVGIDQVRKMPPRSQALLGYAVHDALATGGAYVGAVGMRDPQELLRTGEL